MAGTTTYSSILNWRIPWTKEPGELQSMGSQRIGQDLMAGHKHRVHVCVYICIYTGFPGGSDGKEFPCNVGDLGMIPGLGRCPGERNGYPLQYSGLENSMNCIGHGVSKSDTTEPLSLHFIYLYIYLQLIQFSDSLVEV